MTILLMLAFLASLPRGSAEAAERIADLHVVSSRPLVVRGTEFAPQERVRVIVLGGVRRASRWTTASKAGTFRLSIQGADTGGCSRLVVAAVGATGHAHRSPWWSARCPPTPPRR